MSVRTDFGERVGEEHGGEGSLRRVVGYVRIAGLKRSRYGCICVRVVVRSLFCTGSRFAPYVAVASTP